MSTHSPSPLSARQHQAFVVQDAKHNQGQPIAGELLGLLVSLLALVVVTAFLTQRYLAVKVWKKTPFVIWTVFAVLVDSWAFAFATIILQHGPGPYPNPKSCSVAIFLCLTFYFLTKSIVLFLAEKAFIVRNGSKKRLKSKLYLFNTFGLVCLYVIVLTFNFIYRISRLENGRCIIGTRRFVILPLVCCDVVANMYLTTLFLIPLRSLGTSTSMLRTPTTVRLRSTALRSFIGACCTSTSSIINLAFLMALNGESSWVCFLSFLFSALVIQWVTRCDDVNRSCYTCASCVDHHSSSPCVGRDLFGICSVSEAGAYDAVPRRSSVGWCRRPSDGTMIAASPRKASVASVLTGKHPPSHNNSSSSDYHVAVASAGPIIWDHFDTLFGHDDWHNKPSRETVPGTGEAPPPPAAGDGGAPAVATDTITTTNDAAAAAPEATPLQRPKPSRALPSVRSIRSAVVATGGPSPVEEEGTGKMEDSSK